MGLVWECAGVRWTPFVCWWFGRSLLGDCGFGEGFMRRRSGLFWGGHISIMFGICYVRLVDIGWGIGRQVVCVFTPGGRGLFVMVV